jgi:transposase
MQVKQNLDTPQLSVVADKGYDSQSDVLKTLMQGIIPNVPSRRGSEERVFSIDHRRIDITDNMKLSTKESDVRKCLYAGVLPACLEDCAINVEVHASGGDVGCFKRIDDKHVLCPTGKILPRIKRRNGRHSIFRSHAACRDCKTRCIASQNAKEVCFIDGVDYVPTYIYGKSEGLNLMPEDAFSDQHNRALYGSQAKRKVVIKIKYDKEMTRKRMCTVEHPFGSVKWYGDAGYLLCRGKRKTSAEIGLSFLGYNMKRAIKMVGAEEMIRKLGE